MTAKFKFTTTPLKDVPLGTVVDGYTLTSRSHTGENAFGWRLTDDGRFEGILLVYSPDLSIEGVLVSTEVTAPTEVIGRLLQQPEAPYLKED